MNKKLAIILGGLFSLALVFLIVFFLSERRETEKKESQKETEGQVSYELNLNEVNILTNPEAKVEEVAEVAQQKDEVDITFCTPSVPIVKGKKGAVIKFVNTGPTETRIVIHKELEFKVHSESFYDLKLDFKRGSGNYTYGCEADDNIIGSILVED